MIKKRKLKKLQAQMDESLSYEQWYKLALEHDELSGAKHWREVDQSSRFDYTQVRLRADKLRSLRTKKQYQKLLFNLNEGVHGNMAGIGEKSLYHQAKSGSKHLIEQYIEEIDKSLRVLADIPNDIISIDKKMDFFYRANICYGRSALMLSGGGMLGYQHVGVAKALFDQGLLPRVISGSSVGAVFAGFLGTHTDEELKTELMPDRFHNERDESAGVGRTLTEHDVEMIVNRLIPDMTFQQAYERTGRQISISVAPAQQHQRSRLLNAISSPNVFIRSAVLASCAIPGVFSPVMLMAEDADSSRKPYLPSRRWVDGSFSQDLPTKRLSRLYSTNHSIVSMVNPIATFWMGDERQRPGELRGALNNLGITVAHGMFNICRSFTEKRGEKWRTLNTMMNSIHGVIDQDYTGDINIRPNLRRLHVYRILSHVSQKELEDLVRCGEQSTYPHIEAIRNCTKISQTLEEILHRFEAGDLHQQAVEFERPRAARRRAPVLRRQEAQSTVVN